MRHVQAMSAPRGGPHLDLGRLRVKTWSKSDFPIAETTWPTYLYIHLYITSSPGERMPHRPLYPGSLAKLLTTCHETGIKVFSLFCPFLRHQKCRNRLSVRREIYISLLLLSAHRYIDPSIHPSIHIYMHTCHPSIYTCTHASIHPSIHPSIHAYIHAYMNTCMHGTYIIHR